MDSDDLGFLLISRVTLNKLLSGSQLPSSWVGGGFTLILVTVVGIRVDVPV